MLTTLCSAQDPHGVPSLDCGVMERMGQLTAGLGWDGMGWDGMGWDGMGWDGMGWDGRALPSVRPTDSKITVSQQPRSCQDALYEGCGFHRSPPLARELLLPRGLFHYSTLLSALLCFLLFFFFPQETSGS